MTKMPRGSRRFADHVERAGATSQSWPYDRWLDRAAQISQLGLLAAAVFGFYYTVIPLYEKAALDEELAKTKAELAVEVRNLADAKYRVLSMSFGSGISHSFPLCTGLLDDFPRRKEEEVLLSDRDVVGCLSKSWEKSIARAGLTPTQIAKFKALSAPALKKIPTLQKQASSDYATYEVRATADESLLPPEPAPGTVSSAYISNRSLSKQQILRKALVDTGLMRIQRTLSDDIWTEIRAVEDDIRDGGVRDDNPHG